MKFNSCLPSHHSSWQIDLIFTLEWVFIWFVSSPKWKVCFFPLHFDHCIDDCCGLRFFFLCKHDFDIVFLTSFKWFYRRYEKRDRNGKWCIRMFDDRIHVSHNLYCYYFVDFIITGTGRVQCASMRPSDNFLGILIIRIIMNYELQWGCEFNRKAFTSGRTNERIHR